MSEQADFFPKAPILDWLPGETLFSLVSRLHVLWGAPDAGRTAELLFGDRRRGMQHDLPGHLGYFAARANGRLGDINEVACERTLLAFYRRFMPKDAEQAVVADMSAGDIAHLKFRMGLLTSRFRANHPLKACADCMIRDVQVCGWAYWHMRHQHPGVWWCPDHSTFLRESKLKSSGVGRFSWTLPQENLLMPVPPNVVRKAEEIGSVAARLEFLIHGLVGTGKDFRLDVVRLKQCYRRQLTARGWTTDCGTIRWSHFLSDYVDYVRPLRQLPELSALPSTEAEAYVQLGRVFSPSRSLGHPLWHLTALSWLFGHVGQFLSAYAPSEMGVRLEGGENISGASAREDDPRRRQLLPMLCFGGASVSAVARSVGVDVTTAMVWATTAGYVIKKRPKTLQPGLRMQLIELLERGEEKLAAATAIGVSVGAVTRTLFTEVGLHERWREARLWRVRDEHRRRWLCLLDDYGASGVKVMRGLATATYAWLYRNDRDWLQAHLPEPLLRPTPTLRDAVWLQKDESLSIAVRKGAIELASDRSRRRILLWELYQAVPTLKPKLRVLDRLPLTRKVVDQVLAWRAPQGVLEDLIGF